MVVHKDIPYFDRREVLVNKLEGTEYLQEGWSDIIKLLVPDEETSVPVTLVPILGMAGTGKTSLARLAYREMSRESYHQTFNKVIMVDISNIHNPEHMFKRFCDEVPYFSDADRSEENGPQLDGSLTYLIILQGSFEEDPNRWYEMLQPLLSCFTNCQRPGINKIVFTSRCSDRSSSGGGSSSELELEPSHLLPDHNLPISKGTPYLWRPIRQQCLLYFQSIAFPGIEETDRKQPFLDVAIKIHDLCFPNLYVTKIIASILSFHPTDLKRWQYIYHILLEEENPTKSIQSLLDLIRDRHNKDFRFMNTLNYFSLFPINYVFDKGELYQLWKIYGHVQHKTYTEDHLRDEDFHKLLSIGFIYSTRGDKTRAVGACISVNSLMHEVVKYLARDDYRLLDEPTVEDVDLHSLQHVSFMVDSSWKAPSWLHHYNPKQLIKSLMFFPINSSSFISIPNINNILENLKALQILDLATVDSTGSGIDAIGKLKHLRYLRLGPCSDFLLPTGILNLVFLETLDLRHSKICQLPTDLHTLYSLKHLHLGNTLIGMPLGLEKFGRLQTFTVSNLEYVEGKLKVLYGGDHNSVDRDFVVTHMINRWIIVDLTIAWSSLPGEPTDDDVNVHEFFKPDSYLECLQVEGWKGVSFPPWTMADDFSTKLKNLVSVNISHCHRCQNLPSFNTLESLESLQLVDLESLEWIEISDGNSQASSSSEEEETYFPSLKYLMLVNLPQLKGWSKVERKQDADSQHEEHDVVEVERTFKCLSGLGVRNCPKLVSMPTTPSLEKLVAFKIPGKLLEHFLNPQDSQPELSSSASSATLKELHIDSINKLESLSINLSSLQTLSIRQCKELKNINISRALPHSQPYLKDLEIEGCEMLNWGNIMPVVDEGTDDESHGLKSLLSLRLTNISESQHLLRGLSCFATLKVLSLNWFYSPRELPESSFENLKQLHQLAIRHFPNLGSLPESLGQLSALHSIELQDCPRLKQLPKSLPRSLGRLRVKDCVHLKRLYQQHGGKDWPLINFIPILHLE